MPFKLANVDGRAALVGSDDDCFDLADLSGGAIGPDPMEALAAHRELGALTDQLGNTTGLGQLGDLSIGPPVPAPRNSLGVGLNYGSHIAESGMEAPKAPVLFTKFPSCICGPNDDVELRSATADYEAELVVVIGTTGRDIAASEAWSHIAGVTAGQDISDRALQFASDPPHFDMGKSRDTYGPIGPVLVSPDSFDDPDDIALRCIVNGEQRQSSSTTHLIYSVPDLVAYVSAVMTLAPGDLIFTGTPEGVGVAKGQFLADADVIVTEIDGIGTMTNRCVGGE